MTTHSKRVPAVSVIVPCRNEERYIERCLDSILASDYLPERLEVLVVDGQSDDRTRTILDDYASRHPTVRVLDNPKRIQSTALNLGIRAARGEILVRMDAHVMYPRSYIGDLVAALLETGADNIGGVLITLPANQTAIGRAIAIAMSHRFGVGNSHFRIGVRQARWVDTVAFFCCRRETFERVGMFDEDLVRDEDDEFNARLIRRGGRTLLVPNVVSYYYARPSLGQIARMSYQYGYFKPLAARKVGRIMTVRQLVPPALVLALCATVVLAPWVHPAALVFRATATAYLVAVVAFSVIAGGKAGLGTVGFLTLVFPALHFSYGVGFVKGALQLALGPGREARHTELPLSR